MLLPGVLNALARQHELAEIKGGFDANLRLVPCGGAAEGLLQ